MLFRQLFDPETSTFTYVLADEKTREAVIIDPVLEQAERDLEILRELELVLRWAVDTHVHADHVTALGTLRERTGCKTALSVHAGTGCADRVLREGDTVAFGASALRVIETPGHTAGCLAYVCDEEARVFTGDALLIRGCGRTDFQQGNARVLYRSVHDKLYALGDTTRVYPGHDYKGRTMSTIAEEKRWNPRLRVEITEDEFVKIMSGLQLAYPKRIDVALPANLQCGVPRGVTATPEGRAPSAWAPVRVNEDNVPEVSAEWVAAGATAARVVDVRDEEEINGPLGHIPGALFAPLDGLTETAAQWARDTPVVLVCHSGARSGRGALALQAMGFTRVASMHGGMLAWHAQHFTVTNRH